MRLLSTVPLLIGSALRSCRSPFAPRHFLLFLLLGSALPLRAGPVAFDGDGTSSITLATPNNWDTNVLPTTTDEAIFTDAAFGAALPASLTNGSAQTWGNLVWDSNSTTNLSGTRITLSGLGGNTNGDLITLGSNVTSGSLSLSFANAASSFITATTGNINVVNAGATLNMNTQFEFNSAVPNQVITKTGAGTLNFANGNNGNAGAGSNSRFVLDGGTLNFSNGNGNMLGGSASTVFEIRGGTSLDTNGVAFDVVSSKNYAQTWAGDFTFKATSGRALNLGTGAVTMTGGSRQITVNASALTVGGAIGDGGNGYGLTKAGAGALTLTGANTYSGSTTILGGTLSLTGGSNRLATGSEVIIANGTSAATSGILNLAGQDQTINKLSSTSSASATKGTVRNNTNLTTATLTVTGTSTFDGIIRNNTSGTGVVALTKSTGGTLTLTGVNTYTGATTVSGGTLLISATGSLAAGSAVSVTGGTLGGSGTVAGLVTTAGSTSVISPGNSPGTLLLSGGLNAAAGAGFDFELGTSSDLLSLGSGVFTGSTAPNGLVFDFSNSGGLAASTPYTLSTFGSSTGLDYTDLLTTTTPSGFALDSSFGTNGFQINGGNLQVQFVAVPEPSTYALLGMGMGAICLLRRKRKA